MMQDWKDDNLNVLDDIERKCDLSKQYSKHTPIVSMHMQQGSMNKQPWMGRWILHIIVMGSIYTVSVFINRRKGQAK